jgi:putative transposase
MIISIVERVKLAARIQRKPTAEPAKSPRDTLERCTAASGAEIACVIEELTCRRAELQRSPRHGWSFAERRQFTTYKAKRAGIPIVAIDPGNTTGTRPECGVIDKANRNTQTTFSCMPCG